MEKALIVKATVGHIMEASMPIMNLTFQVVYAICLIGVTVEDSFWVANRFNESVYLAYVPLFLLCSGSLWVWQNVLVGISCFVICSIVYTIHGPAHAGLSLDYGVHNWDPFHFVRSGLIYAAGVLFWWTYLNQIFHPVTVSAILPCMVYFVGFRYAGLEQYTPTVPQDGRPTGILTYVRRLKVLDMAIDVFCRCLAVIFKVYKIIIEASTHILRGRLPFKLNIIYISRSSDSTPASLSMIGHVNFGKVDVNFYRRGSTSGDTRPAEVSTVVRFNENKGGEQVVVEPEILNTANDSISPCLGGEQVTNESEITNSAIIPDNRGRIGNGNNNIWDQIDGGEIRSFVILPNDRIRIGNVIYNIGSQIDGGEIGSSGIIPDNRDLMQTGNSSGGGIQSIGGVKIGKTEVSRRQGFGL